MAYKNLNAAVSTANLSSTKAELVKAELEMGRAAWLVQHGGIARRSSRRLDRGKSALSKSWTSSRKLAGNRLTSLAKKDYQIRYRMDYQEQ